MLNVAGTLKARRYRQSIELFTQTATLDDSNRQMLGELVSAGLFPADIKPMSYVRKISLFHSAAIQVYEVTMRYIDFEPTKAMYDGVMYGVTSIENMGERGRMTKLLITEIR